MEQQRTIKPNQALDYTSQSIGESLNETFDRRGFHRDNTLQQKIKQAIAPLIADLTNAPSADIDRAPMMNLRSPANEEQLINQFGEQHSETTLDTPPEDLFEDIEQDEEEPTQHLPAYGAIEPDQAIRRNIEPDESIAPDASTSEDADNTEAEGVDARAQGDVEIPDDDDTVTTEETTTDDTTAMTDSANTRREWSAAADENSDDPALIEEDENGRIPLQETSKRDTNSQPTPENGQAPQSGQTRARPPGFKRILANLSSKQKAANQSIMRLKKMLENQKKKLQPLERPLKALVLLRRSLLVLAGILIVFGGILTATFFLAAMGAPIVAGGLWSWRSASLVKIEINALEKKILPIRQRIKKIEKALKLRMRQIKTIRNERRLIITYGQRPNQPGQTSLPPARPPVPAR